MGIYQLEMQAIIFR